LASTGISAGLFAASKPGMERPDINININNWSVANRTAHGMTFHPFPGITLSPVNLRPRSRGSVRLNGPQAETAPLLSFNYLAEPQDLATMVAGLRIVRELISQPVLAKEIVGELEPGRTTESDAELEQAIRASAYSSLHPAGTCRMGSDVHSVVDPRLKVRGLGNLRVADASIMPLIIGGNTNAPTIMIAEKAASMILEDVAL